LQDTPQLVPLQVALPLAGVAQGAQELPQLSTLLFETHSPAQLWKPGLHVAQGVVVQKSTPTASPLGRCTTSVMLGVLADAVIACTGGLIQVATLVTVTELQATLKMSAHRVIEPTGSPAKVVLKAAAPGVSVALSVVRRPAASDVRRMHLASAGTCVSASCRLPISSAPKPSSDSAPEHASVKPAVISPAFSIPPPAFIAQTSMNERRT
jgi:hypothetical protein